MSKPNYPGGFHATEITVFLYSDGRMNFAITKDADNCRPDWNSEPQTIKNGHRCKALKSVKVNGCDWPSICEAAQKAADELRGCTWEEWQKRENPPPARHHGWFRSELTPAGEQAVIPGCERNASPRAKQLDLF